MRNLSGSYLPVVGIVLLALFASIPATSGQSDESVIGTWIGSVTLDTPPAAPPFIFMDLLSFNRGGTVIGTNGISHSAQNPFVPPPLAVDLSDYFGTWVAIGDSHQIAVTLKRLLFAGAKTPTAVYGTFFPGQHVGVASIQGVGTFQPTPNGDNIVGRVTFQLVNVSGQVVFAGSGTVALGRVGIEPMATP